MKRIIYLIILFVAPLMAQEQELFEKGNTAYNDGDYKAAINYYESILDSGQTSAELYFNLANSFYKLNNIAPSIYYYEKALQLNPNDPDIRNNLEFARNMVLDDIEEVEKTGLSRMWREAVSILSYNEWAWMAVTFSVLFAICFLIYYFSRRTIQKRVFFSLSVLVLVLCILAVVFAFQQRDYITNDQFAIIFSEEAEARSEPTLRSDEIFTLHEGTKVEVLETYQDWIKFELANGIQGWMSKDYLKFL